MKKILLIGANGFFGKNISIKLNKFFQIKKFLRKDNLLSINFSKFDVIINCAAEVYDEKKMLQLKDFKENILKLSYGKKKHFLVKII